MDSHVLMRTSVNRRENTKVCGQISVSYFKLCFAIVINHKRNNGIIFIFVAMALCYVATHCTIFLFSYSVRFCYLHFFLIYFGQGRVTMFLPLSDSESKE